NVRLFNHLCAAASVLLMWALLRPYLSRGALAGLLLFVIWPFIAVHYSSYARDAFSDNLFAPMVLAMILATSEAFRRGSIYWLFAAGVLTGLGAGARTSLMTHIAFLGLAVLLYRELGPFLWRRFAGGAAVTIGFILGIAPFTIRNWLVTKQLILIVSSIGQMPYFMNIGPNATVPIPLIIDGRLPTLWESLGQMVAIFRIDPTGFVWHEIKKVLFTLGWVDFAGPVGVSGPWYFVVIPPLFIFTLWLRRIPRPVAFALLAFLASHMTAMVMAAPWTYGYKTILPFLLACLAGSAFLLRRAPALAGAKAPRLTAQPLVGPPRVSVILAGANGRQRVAEVETLGIASEVLVGDAAALIGQAAGDLIAVLPSDPAYTVADLRKLIVFADDAHAVFGRHPTGLWMIRREALPLLRGELTEAGEGLAFEAWLLAIRSGLQVTSIPVRRGERALPPVTPFLRVLLRNMRPRERGVAALMPSRS
ncbi:MAG TPA: glycosyltransferase family 39 protein, partial [Thermoanaerobaculia bacterium]|nr:glycosyltransferase family 39 protein [Thermoanaerobaculia bacterium]